MSDEHNTQGSTTPTPTTLKPSSTSPSHNPLKRKLKAPTEDCGGDDDDCDGIDDDDGHGEPDEELEDVEGPSGVEAAALEPDDGAGVKTKPLSTSEPLVSVNANPTTTSTATATAPSTKITGTVKATGPAPGGAKSPPNGKDVPEEYKNGYISCQICGLQVDIRDRETGEFTVRMWDEHRERCFPNSSSTTARGVPASSSAAPPADLTFAPETTAQSIAHAPTKRRRAKRTEEERIDYLRADPYVAQFEAYRVLCASCDKWIRLRPNSTYCSIPWDAHRKSCLAKKINNKSAYALDQRNALFTKDPDIRKFDAERVLCNRCDQWLSMPPEDHYNAVQKWLNHRAECSKNFGPSSRTIVPKTEIPRPPPLSETSHQLASLAAAASSTAANTSSPKSRHHHHQQNPHHHHHNLRESHGPTASSSAHHHHHSLRYSVPHPYANGRCSQQPTSPSHHPTNNAREHHHPTANANPSSATLSGPSSPSPTSPSSHALGFHDMTPNSFAPIHESRRRNAEQREATLRADRYIEEVEPNRVFCGLCLKWVQLRQDSSFCAYPWVQHRGKCLARFQRRAQKAASIADFKGSASTIRHLNPNGLQNATADEELDELLSDLDADADGAHHDDNEGPPGPPHGHNTRANGRRQVKPSPSSSSSSSDSEDDGEGEADADLKRETKRRRLDGPSTSSGRGYMPHHPPPSHSGPGRLGPLPSSSSSGVRRSSYNAAHPQTQNYASPYTVNSSSPFVRRPSGGEGGWRNGREREYMLHANGSGHQGHHAGSRPGTGYSSTSSSSRRVQQQQHAAASAHHQQHAYQQRERERERERQWEHEMDQEDVVDVDAEGEVVDDVDAEGEVVEVDGGGGESYASGPNGHHHQHTSHGREQEREASAREKHVLGGVWARPPSYQHPVNGRRGQLAIMRRPMGPVGLADLDSVGGRKQFLASSILHLFTTTYESTDDLPISSLLTYLNAAMPVDKHEDFDTAEVVKYVVALSGMPAGSAGFGERIGERWRVMLEGDIVKIVDTCHMIS